MIVASRRVIRLILPNDAHHGLLRDKLDRDSTMKLLKTTN